MTTTLSTTVAKAAVSHGDTITFVVPGPPVPQPRACPGRLPGQMFTPPANGIRGFRQAAALLATIRARQARWERTDSWFALHCEFVFDRPPSHFTKGGDVRSGAPPFPGRGKGCGDAANLIRGLSDAITKAGCVWVDDSRVVDERSRKRYAERGERPHSTVTITRLA